MRFLTRALVPLLLRGAALALLCPGARGASRAPPADLDAAGALRQAETLLADALAKCGRRVAPREAATQRGLYATGGGAALEVRFGGRDYHLRLQREEGGFWRVAGAPSPAPCGDETLALTMDDVDAYNRIPGLPWRAAMPEAVAGKTVQQLRARLGAADVAGAKERRSPLWGDGAAARRALPALADSVGGVRLPDEYDARERYSTEYPCEAFRVRDQGGCGACSAFAFTSAAAARLCLQRGRDPRHNVALSPQQLMEAANGRDVCKGVDTMGLAQMYAGAPRWKEEHCYPFAPSFTDTAGRGCPRGRNFSAGEPWPLPGGNEALMRAEVLARGPMPVAIVVRNAFWSYDGSGVYVDPGNSSVVGGHVMMLVGWGTDEASGLPYWLLQNSHGVSGALAGFVRIARGVDMANIESRAVFAFTPEPSPQECPGTECPMGAILYADCTCSEPRAGGAPPDVAAAEDALLAPRIEANRATAAALRALDGAPAFVTYNNRTLRGGETVWLSGTPARACVRVPRLRLDTRQTTMLIFESAGKGGEEVGAWQDLPSVAIAPAPNESPAGGEACGMVTLSAGAARFAEWGVLWRFATRPVGVETGFFRVQALTVSLGRMLLPSVQRPHANLTVAWEWGAGGRLPGDDLRLVSATGRFSYPISMTTPTDPSRPWTGQSVVVIPRKTASERDGVYRAQLFRAAAPTTPVFSHPIIRLPDNIWGQYNL